MDRTAPLTRRACLLLGLGAASVSQSQAGDYDLRHQARASLLLPLVRPGDVVFRSGRSVESLAVRAVSGGQPWSHVGVAVRARGEIGVVHAAPAEYGAAAGVHCTSWPEFVLPADVHGAGVYRVEGAPELDRERIAHAALSMVGRPFNDAYRLSDPSALYCTQLVLHAVSSVDPDIEAWVQPTPISLLPEPVLLPHALLQWPRMRAVQPSTFP